jgi:hypothetical protein
MPMSKNRRKSISPRGAAATSRERVAQSPQLDARNAYASNCWQCANARCDVKGEPHLGLLLSGGLGNRFSPTSFGQTRYFSVFGDPPTARRSRTVQALAERRAIRFGIRIYWHATGRRASRGEGPLRVALNLIQEVRTSAFFAQPDRFNPHPASTMPGPRRHWHELGKPLPLSDALTQNCGAKL